MKNELRVRHRRTCACPTETPGVDAIARKLEIAGRTFVVIPVGRLDRPPAWVTRGIDPDFQKFDRALKTQMRPLWQPNSAVLD